MEDKWRSLRLEKQGVASHKDPGAASREYCFLSGAVGATQEFLQHTDINRGLFPEGYSRKWIQNQEAGQDTLAVCSQVLAVKMKESRKH